MDHRTRSTEKSVLRMLTAFFIIMLLFTSMGFAASPAKDSPPDPSRDFSHRITSKDVRRYGTFHGRNASRIPIITYHAVVSDRQKHLKNNRDNPWVISESAFKKQMHFLRRKHYRTISCDEFYLWYRGRIKLPKRSVMITFDDGVSSSIEKSAPYLNRYNMKATYFIIGRYAHIGGSKRLISEKKVRQLRDKYPNIEFQSHTYDLHYPEAYLKKYSVFYRDARRQKKVFHFNYVAYPHGNSSDAMIRAYKKNDIRMGFSFGDYGYADRSQDRFHIKRLAVKDTTTYRLFREWFLY